MSLTLRVKNFKVNPLLKRKQFMLDVYHPDSGTPTLASLREQVSKLYKVTDSKCILLFGFNTKFGGGRTRGFGVIYDNLAAAKDCAPAYRLRRNGVDMPKKEGPTRRAKKDVKNRCKKVRGIEKNKIRKSGASKK